MARDTIQLYNNILKTQKIPSLIMLDSYFYIIKANTFELKESK